MAIKDESRLAEMMPAHLGELSILERKVAAYLLKHEDKIQEMDISDIAKASDVSKATVVRFCKTLGFKGLKDFKIYYEAGKSAFPLKLKKLSKDSTPEEINATFHAGICRISEKTLNEDNLNVLVKIAAELKTIDKITILFSDANFFASNLANRLIALNYDVNHQSISEFLANPKTIEGMLFIVSPAGDNNNLSPYIKNAKERGIPVSVMTLDSKSWMAVKADNLLVPFSEKILDEDKLILARIGVMVLLEELSILMMK
ncbi:MAG: MurR/RpiR family transcriptional regulator [Spirochaetales bacterium]|nr:MurR/RpiR family transcriptional regulator [Spirochaetales bacterium]